jgi:hypothetical protein
MTAYDAYYMGRNAWFPGERIPKANPLAGTPFAKDWTRGLRDVLAEERLNLCTAWDKD